MKFPKITFPRWIKDRLNFHYQQIGLSLFVIAIVGISATWVNLNNNRWDKPGGVVHNDIISYYSYLPAFFIYKDLTFSYIDEDPAFFHDKFFRYYTADGRLTQKMTLGLSMLYSPFFLMGHLTAWLTGAKMTGYSPPYMFFLLFSSLVYLLLGLLVLRKVLLKHFSDHITALVLLVVVFATNLFYYATLEAAMSHAYNFALFSFFIWLTIKWHEKPNLKYSLLTGLVIGLITVIRPTNAVLALFFILFNVFSIATLKQKVQYFLQNFRYALVITGIAIIVGLPQLFFWKYSTGHWLYYSYGDEGFFFNNPQIFRGLFSYRKGWLVYTPVMLFALAGIFFLYKRHKQFFLPILVFTIVNLYIIYSWWSWWYGGSFGSRPMIDSYPLMAVSLAAFIDTANRKAVWLRIVTLVLMLLFTSFSIFQTIQYKYGVIHFVEMSKAAYWHSFGKMHADWDYYDKLEPIHYPSALKGIYKTVPKLKPSIRQQAFTSFEMMTADSIYYYSDDQHFRFRSGGKHVHGFARSGEGSLLLTEEMEFGASMDFGVRANESYHLSAWKYPASSRASIVFAAPNPLQMYQLQELISEKDESGWGKMEFTVTTPKIVDGQYRIYIWNKGLEKVYIDDLLIKRIE
jgi:hypothetical protein